ncbi:MAG: hypothetical protein H7Y22_02545 [Gemmatimonadaceae bacterium]|nr:hypothetical protein [Gloeobacterales cyanobacterium ES-bin-141]
MSKFVVLLFIAAAAVMLPQQAHAQDIAQSMPGMEMQKGSEARPDTAKASGMSCCCSKKDDSPKKSEPTGQSVR